jgi:copper(I)-binding protein
MGRPADAPVHCRKREFTVKFLMLALAVASAAPAMAHDYRKGALLIDHPVIRVASPAAKTGAGYMTIRNTGTQPDRLLSVTTAAATRADLHGTLARGNVMMMREQAGGVPVPAGGTVRFASGGLHVMFIGLKAPVPDKQRIKARLTFEKAGAVDVEFLAEAAGGAHHHH